MMYLLWQKRLHTLQSCELTVFKKSMAVPLWLFSCIACQQCQRCWHANPDFFSTAAAVAAVNHMQPVLQQVQLEMLLQCSCAQVSCVCVTACNSIGVVGAERVGTVCHDVAVTLAHSFHTTAPATHEVDAGVV
jgi:hypothetical protein